MCDIHWNLLNERDELKKAQKQEWSNRERRPMKSVERARRFLKSQNQKWPNCVRHPMKSVERARRFLKSQKQKWSNGERRPMKFVCWGPDRSWQNPPVLSGLLGAFAGPKSASGAPRPNQAILVLNFLLQTPCFLRIQEDPFSHAFVASNTKAEMVESCEASHEICWTSETISKVAKL